MEDPFDLPPDVLRRVPLFAELSKVLSWTGGPVNWDLAGQIATSIAAGEQPDPAVASHDQDALDDQVSLAARWLSDETGLEAPPAAMTARAVTPAGWAENNLTSMRDLLDPIAAKVSGAMSQQGAASMGDEASAMIGQALGQMAPMFMGIQAGSIVGALAREVTGVHELGLPSDDDAVVIVLPAVDRVAQEYHLDRTTVRQVIAVRAAAHRMVYDGFPRGRFFAKYLDYVASLSFDFSDSIRKLQEIDLSDPARVQEALGDEGLFTHESSPEGRAAARSIATLQSLLTAYADAAVDAVSARIGDTSRVVEALRRRAASDTTGSIMLARFIGLDTTPDENAASFVRAILDQSGWDTLNRLWADPDAFPTDDELADPPAWQERIR